MVFKIATTFANNSNLLKPFDELSGFERNRIKEQKIKSFHSSSIRKKLQHKRDYQILIGQPYKLFTKKNQSKYKKEDLAYKKSKYSKHTKGKQHIEFNIQKYGRKKLILFKKNCPIIILKGIEP